MNQMPVEKLRELFSVSADGQLIRNITTSPRSKAGQVCGTKNGAGYLTVTIDRRQFLVHRIVFAINAGVWPIGIVDHRNRNRSDNDPKNLRPATPSQNGHNAKLYSTNTSGEKGVSWDAHRNMWQVYICISNRRKFLGRFNVLSEATAAYRKAQDGVR